MSEAAVEVGGDWVPEDSFGIRLIAIRKAQGWTQEQAAAICEVDDGSWSNWENGSRPRGMDVVVRKIAARTGVNRDWLMWGDSRGTGRYPVYGQVRAALDLVHYVGPDQLTIDDAPRYDRPVKPVLVTVG